MTFHPFTSKFQKFLLRQTEVKIRGLHCIHLCLVQQRHASIAARNLRDAKKKLEKGHLIGGLPSHLKLAILTDSESSVHPTHGF